MLTGLLFGIIVPMFLSYPDNAQDILDRGNGIYVGNTGCHNTKLIAAHNYKKLGKKILKIMR